LAGIEGFAQDAEYALDGSACWRCQKHEARELRPGGEICSVCSPPGRHGGAPLRRRKAACLARVLQRDKVCGQLTLQTLAQVIAVPQDGEDGSQLADETQSNLTRRHRLLVSGLNVQEQPCLVRVHNARILEKADQVPHLGRSTCPSQSLHRRTGGGI